ALSICSASGARHHVHPFTTRRSSDLDKGERHQRIVEFLVRRDPERITRDGVRYGAGEEHVIREDGARGEGAAHRITCSSPAPYRDRKSTRLNSSHVSISYAVFCLKKK